jgi:phosphoglycolate phosphatase
LNDVASRTGPAPTRLVVFDLDGTLIDSRADLAASANRMLSAYGAGPLPERDVAAMVGDGARLLISRVLAAAGVEADLDQALEHYLAIYDRLLFDTTRLYDGVAEVLDALSGRVALAVLTNKPLAPSARLLDHFDVARYFMAVIGGDGIHARKPSPAGLNALIARAAADPASTVFVGDSQVDLETSRNAGVRAAIARYGFGFNDMLARFIDRDDIVLDRAIDLIPVLAPTLPAQIS